jgi:transposase InsO family protein
MGVTIQFESHRVELAAIVVMEHDPTVLEYYDQPPPVKLLYPSRGGRSLGVIHTPDFFVIRPDGAGWEEWKTERDLTRLSERMPGRYTRDDGRWCCPPGDRHAEPLGLYYRVRTSSEINWIFQRNVALLEDYYALDPLSVEGEAAAAARALVGTESGITLAELARRIDGLSRDEVYRLIVSGAVYVDLYAAPLVEPDRVRMFRDSETAAAYVIIAGHRNPDSHHPAHALDLVGGTAVMWDGRAWTIANVGARVTTLLGEEGRIVELPTEALETLITQGKLSGVPATKDTISPEGRQRVSQATPEDLQEANRRYDIIAPRLRGQRITTDRPDRTVRHWVRRWRHAEQAHGAGFIGLLPRHADRGNRTRKLPVATINLMHELIRDRYETLTQKRSVIVYGELVRECARRGIITPSYKTFRMEIRRRPQVEQTKQRRGPRAAYARHPFHWELTLTTPRHGDRPFEIGHIDHTELDIELLAAQTGRNLGRPWLTILIDAYSRRFLAVYLTFDPPSYRSAMMGLRDCVRQHGRLPATIVVDGGREFDSVYFETLLARYGCVKKTRPPAKPRFGSVCERLFGTTNTQFIHNLVGNTQIMRQVRQVTKAIQPREHARWTLDRLYRRLGEWAYEIYDTAAHPALGMSPREAFVSGLTMTGERSQRRIPYDEDFLMFTLPTTRKGTAKVDSRAGIKINHLYYWSDSFRDPEVEGRQVPVRYDPFNVAIAYAMVRGRWVRCIAGHYARFEGRSERELMLAAAEIRRQRQQHGRGRTVTAATLAEFLASVDAEEKLLSQRTRDREARAVHLLMGGGPSHEVSGRLDAAPRAGQEPGPRRPLARTDRHDAGQAISGLSAYQEF